jgi:glycosyltransferase involved in cell wall biosynthesis
VVAVAEGGPRSLIEDGRTGRLCPPEARALASAVCELASSPMLRRRLAEGGLAAVRARTWERALGQLAAGYGAALEARPLSGGVARRTAA